MLRDFRSFFIQDFRENTNYISKRKYQLHAFEDWLNIYLRDKNIDVISRDVRLQSCTRSKEDYRPKVMKNKAIDD